MDKNRINSIENIVDELHSKTNGIHMAILQENFEGANELVTDMEESLKHLKQNLKIDDI